MWTYIIVAAVSIIAAVMLRPKVENSRPTKEEFDIPTAEPGTRIYVLFGTREIKSSFVAWWGDVRITAIKAKGGK